MSDSKYSKDSKMVSHRMDVETKNLLHLIAEIYAFYGEKPNESKTLRRLIRQEAVRLGLAIHPQAKDSSNEHTTD
jgi:hypothetical protein